MPAKRNYDSFIQPGFVSVWIGDFCSEDDLEDYLDDKFPMEFGFVLPPEAPCEIAVKSEPVEIGNLVQDFSCSNTFDFQVVDAARSHGITAASCMFIIYNVKYDTPGLMVAHPQVKYIGAVPFPGF